MCVQTAREDWWLDHFKVKWDMLMENIARLVLIIIKLKGVRMDDKGNVYVADFEPSHNWRFRYAFLFFEQLSNFNDVKSPFWTYFFTGVTTIAGGTMLSSVPWKRDQGVTIDRTKDSSIRYGEACRVQYNKEGLLICFIL